MELKDQIKITDALGFVYEVTIIHHPTIGVSIAYYDDERIASREYGRMLPPVGDNDGEWESWQERFMEWIGEPMCDLELECQQYFNNKKQ